jgi:hypothetical protein
VQATSEEERKAAAAHVEELTAAMTTDFDELEAEVAAAAGGLAVAKEKEQAKAINYAVLPSPLASASR